MAVLATNVTHLDDGIAAYSLFHIQLGLRITELRTQQSATNNIIVHNELNDELTVLRAQHARVRDALHDLKRQRRTLQRGF